MQKKIFSSLEQFKSHPETKSIEKTVRSKRDRVAEGWENRGVGDGPILRNEFVVAVVEVMNV